MTAAFAPETSTVAVILTLLDGIERHGSHAPVTLAFRSALRRKGQDLGDGGGPTALANMRAQLCAADPAWADARETVITASRAGLPPLPGGV